MGKVDNVNLGVCRTTNENEVTTLKEQLERLQQSKSELTEKSERDFLEIQQLQEETVRLKDQLSVSSDTIKEKEAEYAAVKTKLEQVRHMFRFRWFALTVR